MKRIELILMKLKEKTSTDAKGFSATEIAEELNLTRGNVSTDLNKLVSEGK